MKKTLLLITVLLTIVTGAKADVTINRTNFRDDNFRSYLLAMRSGRDGVFTDEELASITTINVAGKGIGSLKGIEYFTSLEVLICYSNDLASLNLSQNTALVELDCSSNELTSLDVSNNTALEKLDCSSNQLGSLDVRNNKNLAYLECHDNQIKVIDMDFLIASLPENKTNEVYKFVAVSNSTDEGNVCTKTQVEEAKNRGWTTYSYDYDRNGISPYEGGKDIIIKKGDVNGDQTVDVADISTVIDAMAGKGTDGQKAAADVNGDKTVDVADIALVIDIMAGKYVEAYTFCPDGHHPHLIDLGLPSGTKWACCNVGASKPEDYGGYFAWGETETKEVYNWTTYIHCDGSSDTCHDIGTDIAGTEYDTATANWGAPWRMPTLEQFKELLNNCISEWTTQNGVNGRKFVGPNGGTIFLPVLGGGYDSDLYDVYSQGFYWSSTLNERYPLYPWFLFFYSDGAYCYSINLRRYYGFTVRPVR